MGGAGRPPKPPRRSERPGGAVALLEGGVGGPAMVTSAGWITAFDAYS
jgi:hypothetical protein